MRTFLIEQWRLVVALLASVMWISAFPIWRDWVTKEPLNVPISLSPAGSVEKIIQIRIPEKHIVQFEFERNGIDFAQLQRLIGAMAVCLPNEECSKGVPVPVRWTLTNSKTGGVVSAGEVESVDSNAWSGTRVYRTVGNIQVQPGKYIFKAEITRPVPEFAHIRAHIAIGFQAKTSTTWQMALIWWGALGYVLLAWPVAVCAAILLLWRTGMAYRSRVRTA